MTVNPELGTRENLLGRYGMTAGELIEKNALVVRQGLLETRVEVNSYPATIQSVVAAAFIGRDVTVTTLDDSFRGRVVGVTSLPCLESGDAIVLNTAGYEHRMIAATLNDVTTIKERFDA